MSDWDKFTAGLTQGMPIGMNLWAMLQDQRRYRDEQEQRQEDRDVEQTRYNREIKYRDLQDEEAQSRYERELNRIKTGEMEETADNTYFRDLLRGGLEGNRLPESGLPPAGTGYAQPGGQGMTYTDPRGTSMSLPGATALPTGISPFQEREPSLEYGSLGSPEMLNDPDALMRLIGMAGSENLFRPVTPPDTFDPAQFSNLLNIWPFLPENADLATMLPPELQREGAALTSMPPEQRESILHPPAEPLPPHYFNPESGFGVWDPNTGSISTVPGTGSRGGETARLAPLPANLGGIGYEHASNVAPEVTQGLLNLSSRFAQLGIVSVYDNGGYIGSGEHDYVRGEGGQTSSTPSNHGRLVDTLGLALDIHGFTTSDGVFHELTAANMRSDPVVQAFYEALQTQFPTVYTPLNNPNESTNFHIEASTTLDMPRTEEPTTNHTDTVNDWWESLDQSMRGQYNTEFAQMGYTANSQTVRDRAYDRYGQPATTAPTEPSPAFQSSGVEGVDRYGQEFEASVEGFVENAKASGWPRDYVIMMLNTYIEQYGLTGVVTAEEIYAEEFGI